MADVGATVQTFLDAGSAAQQGNWDAAAAAAAPAIEQEVAKATKPKPGDDCAAAAAKGALGGAAAGASAGAAFFPPFGALIGAGVGALAGGLAAGAEGGCFDSATDWRAEVQSLYADAPFVRVVDVNGPALRKQPRKLGEVWSYNLSPSEKFLDRFPLGRSGLTIGRYFWLLRRHRELGGGSTELARIVGLAAPTPSAATSTKAEADLLASKAYRDASKSADQLGATDAGKLLRNQLKNMRIAALMRGGFDRAEAEKRVLGQPYGATVAGITYLRGIIAQAEPQASYVGPLRSIFGRSAQPATTRATSVDTESSPVLPLALGAAAVGAFYFLGK